MNKEIQQCVTTHIYKIHDEYIKDIISTLYYVVYV